MKRALVALLLCTCASSKEETKASAVTAEPVAAAVDGGAASDAGGAAGASTLTRVKGGEVLRVGTAEVQVIRVNYVNSPCPEGAKCVHSGIVKTVNFKVTGDGPPEEFAVGAGNARASNGVLIKVLSVDEGPSASLELLAEVRATGVK